MRPAILLLAAATLASGQQVIRPRDSAADYPVHAEQKIAAVGAALLTDGQVHGSFSSELDRAYLVVEVGLFPNEQIDVSQVDFSLLPAGSRTALYPVRPAVAAAVLQKPVSDQRRPRAPGDITLYPTIGVAYESGGAGRPRGWTTAAGVGVGIGDSGQASAPKPASTTADRRTMETELSEKALPEGLTTRPVAGYLYFPLPNRNRDVAYDLEYTCAGEKFRLPLGRYSMKK